MISVTVEDNGLQLKGIFQRILVVCQVLNSANLNSINIHAIIIDPIFNTNMLDVNIDALYTVNMQNIDSFVGVMNMHQIGLDVHIDYSLHYHTCYYQCTHECFLYFIQL